GIGRAVLRHEGADAVERVGGDAAAVAQAAGELAVVDGAAAESRLREPGLTAEIGDFPQNRVVHGTIRRFLAAGSRLFCRLVARPTSASEPTGPVSVNHKRSHRGNGLPLGPNPTDCDRDLY